VEVKILPAGTHDLYEYVVTLSRYEGKWLLSRRKGSTSWELQGGHVESGETLEDAARRELWEESGAKKYTLYRLCDYTGPDGSRGAAFWAEVTELAPLPEQFEMGEVRTFAELPGLTYPAIIRKLVEEYSRQQTK